MYHRFGETKYPSTNITVGQLENHLQYLKEEQFEFIFVKDLIVPESLTYKTISITVDDAYLSFYEVGLPIFEKYNINKHIKKFHIFRISVTKKVIFRCFRANEVFCPLATLLASSYR